MDQSPGAARKVGGVGVSSPSDPRETPVVGLEEGPLFRNARSTGKAIRARCDLPEPLKGDGCVDGLARFQAEKAQAGDGPAGWLAPRRV
jgi:hypothetical protein